MSADRSSSRRLTIPGAILIFLAACSMVKPSLPSPTQPAATIFRQVYPTSSPSSTPTLTSSPTPSITITPSITPTPTFIPITPVIQSTPLPESKAVISAENADRLTLLARWGQGNPGEIAYSPDGKYFVAGTTTGLYFYDPIDYSIVHYIPIQSAVSHLAVSPDSQVVAAVATDQVILYHISDWQVLTTISVEANSADFSPDGKTLVVGVTSTTIGNPGYLQSYDASTGKILNYVRAEQGAWAVKFSPRGDYIGSAGYVTTMWSVDGNFIDQQGPYKDDNGSSFSVSFSPDGTLLAEGANNKLHLWHVLENGHLIIYRNIDLSQYKYADVQLVAFSPDGKLVAASLGNGIGVWEISSGLKVFTTTFHGQITNGLAWSTDGYSVAISSNQTGVQVWDVQSGQRLVSLDLHSGTFSSLAWSPDGQKLAVGAEEGEVDIFSSQNGTMINSFGDGYYLNSLAFSHDSQILAVGYEDRIVNLWDVTGMISHTLEGVGYGSTDVTFSTDGTIFAATTAESYQAYPQVRLWNTSDWSVKISITVGNFINFSITGFALAPDQRTGAISISDSTYSPTKREIQIISVADGSILTALDLDGRPGSMEYSPDGASLAVLVSNNIYIWQTDDWNLPPKQIAVYSSPDIGRPNNLQYSIAWSSDSQLLAVGLQNGHIQVLNVQNGQRVTLSGHTMYVTGVAFSPDGRYLASISLDGTVRLWGIQ